MADASELYPSSAEDSEPEYVDPQIPAISPLQICDNDWRTDLTLHLYYFVALSLRTHVSHSQTKVTISATFFRWNRTI
jgi:hypothetical protein